MRRHARRVRMRPICGNGRTRSAKSASSTASLVGAERAPAARPREQLVRRGTERLKKIPGPTSSTAVRPPTRISSASRPSRISRPRPCPAVSNHGARSHAPTATWSTLAVASCRAAIRARDVEFLGELSVGVEQVCVERDRLGLIASQLRMAWPPPMVPAGQPLGVRPTRHSLSGLSDLPKCDPVYALVIAPRTTADVGW